MLLGLGYGLAMRVAEMLLSRRNPRCRPWMRRRTCNKRSLEPAAAQCAAEAVGDHMRILTTTLFIVGLMAIAAGGQTTEDPTLRDPERRVSKDVKKSVPFLGEIPLLGSFFSEPWQDVDTLAQGQ